MENIENWIYIIFIVIAAISSIVKSANKKRSHSDGQPPLREIIVTENDEGAFHPARNVFPDKDFPSDATTRKPQKSVKQIAQSNRRKMPSYLTNEEGASSLTSEQSRNIAILDDEQTGITRDSLPSDTNEWRKAFVYNEIFARKY